MSKILITGGAGFIGSHQVDALLAAGHTVTILDIKPKSEAVNIAHVLEQVTYQEGDIRDSAVVAQVCKNQDYVIHLAAIVSVPRSVAEPIETHDVNVNGMLTVLEAAAAAGVKRFIYASSAAVYGDCTSMPLREEVVGTPQSPYAIHKTSNELYATHYADSGKIETIGLRYFNVYGTRQDPSSPYSGVITLFTKCIVEKAEPTVFGDGAQTRDFVHVSDIVSGNTLALTAGTSGSVYNLARGESTSINELLTTLSEVTGHRCTPIYTSARAGDVLHSAASIARAQAELGFVPKISLAEGLRTLSADRA